MDPFYDLASEKAITTSVKQLRLSRVALKLIFETTFENGD